MNFDELIGYLKTVEEFQNINDWKVTRISVGTTSDNTYRFSNKEKDFFIKEITVLEQNILPILRRYKLRIAPKVFYPELLQHSVLVTDYISGGHLQDCNLPKSLIQDYAIMQNKLNSN